MKSMQDRLEKLQEELNKMIKLEKEFQDYKANKDDADRKNATLRKEIVELTKHLNKFKTDPFEF